MGRWMVLQALSHQDTSHVQSLAVHIFNENPIFLTVFYFSVLETHQNLTSINFGKQI